MVSPSFFKEQRVVVLVDVQNMYYSAKNLYNAKVNFDEILRNSVRGRTLVRAIAYAIKADVKDESNFHDALEKIGFDVKLKDLLVFYGGHKKGDWDIGIAMDAVRAAEKADVIVVVSGDGDFKEMYEYVRGRGCRIEVMAFGKTASSSVKDYVDDFIDMDKDKKYLIPLKGESRRDYVSNAHSSAYNNSQKVFSDFDPVMNSYNSSHQQAPVQDAVRACAISQSKVQPPEDNANSLQAQAGQAGPADPSQQAAKEEPPAREYTGSRQYGSRYARRGFGSQGHGTRHVDKRGHAGMPRLQRGGSVGFTFASDEFDIMKVNEEQPENDAKAEKKEYSKHSKPLRRVHK